MVPSKNNTAALSEKSKKLSNYINTEYFSLSQCQRKLRKPGGAQRNRRPFGGTVFASVAAKNGPAVSNYNVYLLFIYLFGHFPFFSFIRAALPVVGFYFEP